MTELPLAATLRKVGDQLIDAAVQAPPSRTVSKPDKAFTLLMGMYLLALAELKELKGHD